MPRSLALLIAVLLAAAPATGQTFSNPAPISIPTQFGGPALLYPSEITVPGPEWPVVDVNVTLHDLTHSRPIDLDILLVSPSGRPVFLVSDAAGVEPGVDGVTYTIDDEAAGPLPFLGTPASGSYQQSRYTEFEDTDVMPFPAPPPPTYSPLSAFDGPAPNGTWQLFVHDDRDGEGGIIAGGWSLTFTLAEPAFSFVQPTPGQEFRIGAPLKPIWTSPEPAPDTVSVVLLGGGSGLTIYTGPTLAVPDFGMARYVIPPGTTPATDYRVRIVDADDPSRFGISEPFTIYDPADRFAFIVPERRDQFALGGTTEVLWLHPAHLGGGTVELSLVDAATGAVVSSVVTANDTVEPVAWGTPPPGKYVMTVRSVQHPTFGARSAPFHLGVVGVTSPARSVVWAPFSTYEITWQTPTLSDPAAVTDIFLKRPGEARRVIAIGTENDGSFEYTVPEDVPDAGDYTVLVQVRHASGTDRARSGAFTISSGTRAPGPEALAHFARPLGVGADEATITVHGLPDGAEVAAFAGDRLVGAARAAGGEATLFARGTVAAPALVAAGLTPDEAAETLPDGTAISLRVWTAERGEHAVDARDAAGQPVALEYADGAESTVTVVPADAQTLPGPDEVRVSVHPNPASGAATVRVTLPAAGAATVEVYDVLGRRVMALMEGDAVAGTHALDLPAGRLPAGVYVVRVRTLAGDVTERLTVVR